MFLYFTSLYICAGMSPCALPREVGPCTSFRERYYFDMDAQMCRKFR